MSHKKNQLQRFNEKRRHDNKRELWTSLWISIMGMEKYILILITKDDEAFLLFAILYDKTEKAQYQTVIYW